MATMSGSSRRFRVAVAGGSLPGEGPRDVDAGSERTAIRRIDPGTLAVTGPDGVTRTARVGLPRAAADGTREVEVVVDGWRFELTIEDDRPQLTGEERMARILELLPYVMASLPIDRKQLVQRLEQRRRIEVLLEGREVKDGASGNGDGPAV